MDVTPTALRIRKRNLRSTSSSPSISESSESSESTESTTSEYFGPEDYAPQIRTNPAWDFQDQIETLLQATQERDTRLVELKAELEEQDALLAAIRTQSAIQSLIQDNVRDVQRSILKDLARPPQPSPQTQANLEMGTAWTAETEAWAMPEPLFLPRARAKSFKRSLMKRRNASLEIPPLKWKNATSERSRPAAHPHRKCCILQTKQMRFSKK